MNFEFDQNRINDFIDNLKKSILKREGCNKEQKKNYLYNLPEREEYYKKFIYDYLNIVGGAFSVLEKISNESLLLFRKEKNHNLDVKNSDFFWFPYEAKYYKKKIRGKTKTAETIDSLFITTRKSQKLNNNPPDFLKYLESVKKYKYQFLINVNLNETRLNVLYCDSAEILIVLLCYFIVLKKYYNSNKKKLNWPTNSIEDISIVKNADIAINNDIVKNNFEDACVGKEMNFELICSKFGIINEGQPTNFFNNIKNRLTNVFDEEITFENLEYILEKIISDKFNIKNCKNYNSCLQKIHSLARFPILPYIELCSKIEIKEVALSHLVFPVWQSYSFVPEYKLENSIVKSYNVVFALLTIQDNIEYKQTYFDCLFDIMVKLGNVIADIVFYNTFASKSIVNQAMISAISTIFARNYAHNIGSHVAIRSTNEKIKARLIKFGKDLKEPAVINWLDHLKTKLDIYEIRRNEFLADYKIPSKNMMFYRDILLPFCENTLLMDNIAASESIFFNEDGVFNRLVIRAFATNWKELKAEYEGFEECNGKIIYPDNFPYYLKVNEKHVNKKSLEEAINLKKIKSNAINNNSDIEVCLSNEHAFYSILENFIRNSAKHNRDKFVFNMTKEQLEEKKSNCEYLPEKLEVSIVVDDEDEFSENHLSVSLFDNVSQVRGKDLKLFHNKIISDLLNESGEINKNNLGIADIKVNAHLLSSNEDMNEQNLKESLQLIYCESDFNNSHPHFKLYSDSFGSLNIQEDKLYRLGFRFKLCKPKKVLWIGNSFELDDFELRKNGIIAYSSIEDFESSNSNSLASFDFAILEVDALNNLSDFDWERLLIKLPFRVLLNQPDFITSENYMQVLIRSRRIFPVTNKIYLSKEKNFDFFLLKDCWENWLAKWEIDKKNINLLIYFEDENIYEQWKQEKRNNLLINDRYKFIFATKNKETKIIEYSDNTTNLFNENNYNIIYDHHGSLAKNLSQRNNVEFIFNNSYIQFDGSSIDFHSFYYPSNNIHENCLFLFKAIEAGLIKIAVIDERICVKANYRESGDIQTMTGFGNVCEIDTFLTAYYKDLLNFGRTFLFTHFNDSKLIEEDENQFPNASNLKVIIDHQQIIFKNPSYFSEEINGFDVLIIHRTFLKDVLKKICEGKKNEFEIRKKFIENLHLKFGRIIITSGGGTPHSMDIEANFREFGTISANFTKFQSKISLINIIK